MVLSVLCLFYRVFSVRTVRKILDVFEVVLGVFEKIKEKKDRVDMAGTIQEGKQTLRILQGL